MKFSRYLYIKEKDESFYMREEYEESFLDAYITAALWSSIDNDGNPLDDDYDVNNIDDKTALKMKQDADRFQLDNHDLYTKGGWTDAQAGHDFWLTRNGHGAGFWDRSELDEEIGKELTSKCEEFGEFNLYIGDDGKIHGD